MSLFTLFAIAVGLAMDALAVSVSAGLRLVKRNFSKALKMATVFGIFQAGMPIIGYHATTAFRTYIKNVDHWIAFGLLLGIGLKMIWEAFHSSFQCKKIDYFETRTLLLLAIATSIDALAVGISFALLDIQLFTAVLMIGITTFLISFSGVLVGFRLGYHFSQWADVIGGVILMSIGIHILLDHLIIH
ncbi:MAG: manganese efflux pump MntP family protein [Candidatus Marinimicrobia bacterium]|nr:manganese efflux pump MntP family protein [Candidatus Neomarinimicrobiota bacterium]